MHLDELRDLLTRHARPDWSTDIEGVRPSKFESPYPPTPTTSGTVLALIAQGTKRLALGERVYEYRAGQYLVASVDLPITGNFTEASPEEPALGFGLTLGYESPSQFSREYRRQFGTPPSQDAGHLSPSGRARAAALP
ncbi:hypothetical protein SSPO_081740 [Streptomyces antimycoticus]|uniref:HTH araC/xylS-type domain-containing protein n=1 Tax=Streptomyces antimycoticus TaxID=68175 RepID=A0A499VB94_9ACTN|nr:hypothetical protein SSPO_081740 [Streptomyces antimycoticus]